MKDSIVVFRVGFDGSKTWGQFTMLKSVYLEAVERVNTFMHKIFDSEHLFGFEAKKNLDRVHDYIVNFGFQDKTTHVDIPLFGNIADGVYHSLPYMEVVKTVEPSDYNEISVDEMDTDEDLEEYLITRFYDALLANTIDSMKKNHPGASTWPSYYIDTVIHLYAKYLEIGDSFAVSNNENFYHNFVEAVTKSDRDPDNQYFIFPILIGDELSVENPTVELSCLYTTYDINNPQSLKSLVLQATEKITPPTDQSRVFWTVCMDLEDP